MLKTNVPLLFERPNKDTDRRRCPMTALKDKRKMVRIVSSGVTQGSVLASSFFELACF